MVREFVCDLEPAGRSIRTANREGDRFGRPRSPRHFSVDVNGAWVRFSLDDGYSRHLFMPYEGGKVYEGPVTEALLRTVAGARCFVDVGANVGWYACVAAKHMPNDATVYAFEMDSFNYDLLVENVRLNGCTGIRCIHAAVAGRVGTVRYKRQCAAPSTMHRIVPESSADLVVVEAITLDRFFECGRIKPDVIKIDVEGAEAMVLRGMTRLLQETGPALFLEIHPRHLAQFGTSPLELVAFLRERDYRLYEIPQMRGFGAGQPLRRIAGDDVPESNAMLLAMRGALPEGIRTFG